MITLTWGNIRDREFLNALGKLYANPMDFDMSLSFALMGKEIKSQEKLCNETHESLLKKYGTPDKTRPGTYNLTEATRDEYASEMIKLDAHIFEIAKIKRFDAKALSTVMKFSPQDLMLLEPLMIPYKHTDDLPKLVPKGSPVTEIQEAPASH